MSTRQKLIALVALAHLSTSVFSWAGSSISDVPQWIRDTKVVRIKSYADQIWEGGHKVKKSRLAVVGVYGRRYPGWEDQPSPRLGQKWMWRNFRAQQVQRWGNCVIIIAPKSHLNRFMRALRGKGYEPERETWSALAALGGIGRRLWIRGLK
ncbi:MAG: hypothetical protein HY401_06010 [Elusimicrobia bacterium]|nr:hypothetical protein [Elusimicrobiota bacterium]